MNLIEKSTEKYREATKLNLSGNYGFHSVPKSISGVVGISALFFECIWRQREGTGSEEGMVWASGSI